MAYKFHHVHIKAPDPGKTANWYVEAFDFQIVSDRARASGDRFIQCKSPDGIGVNISSARTNEPMGEGDASTHWGIEHFGLSVDDLDAELERLKGLGAELLEGPTDVPNGPYIAFIKIPDDVRIELLQLR